MSNFNEYFRNQGAGELVKKFLRNPDIYSKKKITSMKWKILDEPPQPSSYYIENGETAVWRVQIEYTIDDKPEILYSVFEIPKEIDGAFIIEGSYRIATNKLGADWNCRIMISGRGDHKIQFDYQRQYDTEKKVKN